jgi:hypothetical protein
MRIELHIGPEQCGASRLQAVLAAKRDQLTGKGIRYAESPGNRNHTRLWMAVTDPNHVDPLRFSRGVVTEGEQALLRQTLAADLAREINTHTPEVLILSAAQLCWFSSRSELRRLHEVLSPFSEDIRVTVHVDEPARILTRVYADQIMDGRAASLDLEMSLSAQTGWWDAALQNAPQIDPQRGIFVETQAAPHWLDYARLVHHWEAVFGAGRVQLRSFDAELFASPDVTEEIAAAFGIETGFGKARAAPPEPPPSASWLARGRQLNALLLKVLARGDRVLPRQLWRRFITEITVGGPLIDPGTLAPVSAAFADDAAALTAAHPGLPAETFEPPWPEPAWTEADPRFGYRASQYLVSFIGRIDKATREARAKAAARDHAPQPDRLSTHARTIMPPLAVANFEKLRRSPFAPHNRIGSVNEEEFAAAFDPAPPRVLPEECTGRVIVGCMKNEAPYILEWVAYHRAIGVDNFLIYTNGCEDGTAEILDGLQEMGVVQHRRNDDWKGKSPQQHALNRSLGESVIQGAEWIIHIDVDEFINVRCGNGTLDDFLSRVPDATNVAMTWRLFGHNGVRDLSEGFVIEQFDTCAPRYCPKPHTVWGFKTMFRNIGAYRKISCHRPNKLVDDMAERVRWVNGSGADMTEEVAKNGWRNSRRSIGYDLLQLNHYALRSAESFLIKRQRGRALHVDRSIGLNYWIRMDWGDHRDITIKRNIPRLRTQYDRLFRDDRLRQLHEAGFAWHRAKAAELLRQPEFRELYDVALKMRLTGTERVAYSLALDTHT